MQSVISVSDARREFSKFLNGVIYERPRAIQRHNRDTVLALSHAQALALLSGYRFSVEYEQEDDGSFSGSLREISDIVANAASVDELKLALAEGLVEYAQEYEKDFLLYFNSPNRKDHFPYVYHVLMHEDVQEVAGLIDA